jgi:ribosome-binding factor A
VAISGLKSDFAMSTRTLRVNELIQRELSNLLRRKYNAEAAPITITGDDEQAADRMKWLRKHNKELRFALGEIIILKHMPVFTFELDTVTDRGNRILGILDEIAVKEKKPAAATPPPPDAS